MIGWNDQNQSNKQLNFNPKRCGVKGSNKQCSQETPNHEKLRMQSTLISRAKKKISPKNRSDHDQEITVAEIEKAKSLLKIISHQVIMVYLRNFIKLLMKYLKQTYICCTLKFPTRRDS